MNRVLSLRLAMYLAVQRELQGIVSSVGTAGLSALLDVFNTRLEAAFDLHEIQAQITAPRTATRDEALDEMIAAALAVAGPLGAYAHQQGLHEAEAVADVTAYSLARPRIVERPTLAQKIHDAARPLLVALTPLGVSEPMLTELQATIDAAKALLHEPRTTIIEKHRATEDLKELFAAIDELLARQVDRAMAPLKRTHPDLHRRYFEARQLPRQRRSATGEPEAAPAPSPAMKAAA